MAGNQSQVRAAQLYDALDLRIQPVHAQPVRAKYVAINPKFCGICGSDLHFYFHSDMANLLKTPHPLSGAALPTTIGHEFAGVITELGPGCREDLHIGDQVTVMPTLTDATCASCLSGCSNTCSQMAFLGIHSAGGMSDRIVVPMELVFKLPKSIDCEIGALIEPLAVAWHGVRLVPELSATARVGVLGAGPVGCGVVLCLLVQGVKEIIVSDPSPQKREFVRSLGATAAHDPAEYGTTASFGDDSFDVVFDCAGAPQTLNTAIASVRARGTVLNLALQSRPASINLFPMTMKELNLKCSIAYTKSDFDAVIQAVDAGRLQARKLVTKRIRMEDLVEEGFIALHRPDSTDCKILVDLSR